MFRITNLLFLFLILSSCNENFRIENENVTTQAPRPLKAWTTDARVLPILVDQFSVLMSPNFLYILGGTVGAGTTGTPGVYYSPRLPGGTFGAFTATSSLVIPRHRHSSVIANNHLYVIGGNAAGGPQSSVQIAALNPDGSVGAWSEGFYNLPVGRRRHTSVVAKGQVYVIGGSNPGFDTVYRATLNIDGTLGGWILDDQRVPALVYHHSSVLYNDYLYVIGGVEYDGVNTNSGKIYYAKINADGSLNPWQTATNELLIPTVEHSSVVLNGRIYLMGGKTVDGVSDKIYSAKILASGDLGPWLEETQVLPAPRTLAVAAMENSEILLFGGTSFDAAARVDTILRTRLSP